MSVAVHHRLEGPEGAPVVVFSNSLGTTLEMWDDQAVALRDRYRVLRFDTRGHGRSPSRPARTRSTTSPTTRSSCSTISASSAWRGAGSRSAGRSA